MTSMICKVVKAGQKAAKLLSYIGKKAVCLRADLGFGTMRLRRKQLRWAADSLRAFHNGSRASEARHIVFSVPKGTPRKAAIRQLYAVFFDWKKTYSPDRQWTAAVHKHDGRYHLHAAVSNYDKDGNPINFRPFQVKEMAAMAFTKAAVSAKGTGKGKGVSVYPRAKKLIVRDLAALLVDEAGRLKDAAWEAFKETGVLSKFRLRKDGSPISFEFGGKRIRFETLKHFLTQPQPTPKDKTMPTDIIKTTEPLPDSLAAKLLKLGFTKNALKALESTLHAAHEERKRSAVKSPTVKTTNKKR